MIYVPNAAPEPMITIAPDPMTTTAPVTTPNNQGENRIES